MGCRIIQGIETGDSCGYAVFYCSTSMAAFGPVMSSGEEARLFQKWLPQDPRTYDVNVLINYHSDFEKEYTCSNCGRFFAMMDPTFRLKPTSVRVCKPCHEKTKKDECEYAKEWRYDEDDLEFIEYGKTKEDSDES